MSGYPGTLFDDSGKLVPSPWQPGVDRFGPGQLMISFPGLAGMLYPLHRPFFTQESDALAPLAGVTVPLAWGGAQHIGGRATGTPVSLAMSTPASSPSRLNPTSTPTSTTNILTGPSPSSSRQGSKTGAGQRVTKTITGIASLYNLPGHFTSTGEPFDKNKMVAAMRPQDVPDVIGRPVWARVTYTPPGSKTARSVVVRINDHGPWEVDPKTHRPLKDKSGHYIGSATRVIDLPKPVFERLGGQGSSREGLLRDVKVELLELPPSNFNK